jgi:hypothetical protein
MDKHPICFRFPRGNGVGVDLAAAGITGFKGTPIEVRLVSKVMCVIWPQCCPCAPKEQTLHACEQMHGQCPVLSATLACCTVFVKSKLH